jgi:hypothetical protein
MHEEVESISWLVENSGTGLDASELESLKREFSAFVFFHLGSDARVEVRNSPSGLSFSLIHQRIHPFQFELGKSRLKSLLKDLRQLENEFLNQLTRHRRSG